MEGACFMWRSWMGCCALALAVSPAQSQTLEELKKENEQLKARIKALEAERKPLAVIVSYNPTTAVLVVKIGERERTVRLTPDTHVHDENRREVRPANRAEKLKPGVKVELVEEDGELVTVNIGGGGHAQDHKHDHAQNGEWKYVDPVKPGWWKPSDEYRPYSWAPPPSEGFFKDLLCGRFVDTHRSSGGTPWIHPFTIEPAHLHRDMYFFYKYAKDAEGSLTDEHELEVHFDWAITRRLGVTIGAPYLGLIDPFEQSTGFGDLEVAPRVVLIESESFFLTANLLMTIPTGDSSRDLGLGEMTMSPSLITWHDLGCCHLPWRNWNTLFLNFGTEIGVESGDKLLTYAVVYSHSFLGPKLIIPHHHGNGDGHEGHEGHDGHQSHDHNGQHKTGGTISHFGPAYPPGLTSLLLEFNGQTELQGDRITFLQMLTGFSYILTENLEFRFGVNFPLNRTSEQQDAQYILSFGYFF